MSVLFPGAGAGFPGQVTLEPPIPSWIPAWGTREAAGRALLSSRFRLFCPKSSGWRPSLLVARSYYARHSMYAIYTYIGVV